MNRHVDPMQVAISSPDCWATDAVIYFGLVRAGLINSQPRLMGGTLMDTSVRDNCDRFTESIVVNSRFCTDCETLDCTIQRPPTEINARVQCRLPKNGLT